MNDDGQAELQPWSYEVSDDDGAGGGEGDARTTSPLEPVDEGGGDGGGTGS